MKLFSGKNRTELKLNISGMSCLHCVQHVEEALKAVDGVVKAKADLKTNTAKVTLEREVPGEQLKKAVADAGYEVTGIEKLK